MQTPPLHRVHRSVNRPLTIWGADRRLFLGAAVIGAAGFNLLGSLTSGLLLFGVLYGLARLVTATDPHLLRILLRSARLRTRYDPAKVAYWDARRGTHSC